MFSRILTCGYLRQLSMTNGLRSCSIVRADSVVTSPLPHHSMLYPDRPLNVALRTAMMAVAVPLERFFVLTRVISPNNTYRTIWCHRVTWHSQGGQLGGSHIISSLRLGYPHYQPQGG